jgi:hypothetical protein
MFKADRSGYRSNGIVTKDREYTSDEERGEGQLLQEGGGGEAVPSKIEM